ncbi:GNAT family N-acetyltransferase [Thalassotalea sp. LPB0316]|uniref:GNAT family N-acetyltransferase n=1 Tax=Thalassotalea sp. LPB0316 TaxID=2769490 RepID=UPI0018684EEA|nr:GNAT family N-acetyltransferase [Thalassotalea sp. LPB0316]QOL25307.1 GNAT family N-acetyltransferase [Thalassotalea sp. LPB0316]
MKNKTIKMNSARLYLREMQLNDADFIRYLYNQPDFINYIGDKGIEDQAAAREYITSGPKQSYHEHGFGLLLVCLNDDTPLGVCGLLQREDLPMPDLGYAIAPEYYQKGYTKEACLAVLDYYQQYQQVLAITDPTNIASMSLLNSLGFDEVSNQYTGWGESKIFELTR